MMMTPDNYVKIMCTLLYVLCVFICGHTHVLCMRVFSMLLIVYSASHGQVGGHVITWDMVGLDRDRQ